MAPDPCRLPSFAMLCDRLAACARLAARDGPALDLIIEVGPGDVLVSEPVLVFVRDALVHVGAHAGTPPARPIRVGVATRGFGRGVFDRLVRLLGAAAVPAWVAYPRLALGPAHFAGSSADAIERLRLLAVLMPVHRDTKGQIAGVGGVLGVWPDRLARLPPPKRCAALLRAATLSVIEVEAASAVLCDRACARWVERFVAAFAARGGAAVTLREVEGVELLRRAPAVVGGTGCVALRVAFDGSLARDPRVGGARGAVLAFDAWRRLSLAVLCERLSLG